MKKIYFYLLLTLTISASLFACSQKSSSQTTTTNTTNTKTSGFQRKDGKEIYLEDGTQVYDKLVEVDGEKYYIGKDGEKVTSDWAIVDNDGNYSYFGAKGIMFKNAIKEINGIKYAFDENGIMQKNGLFEFNNDFYYANNDGSLATNTTVTINGKDYKFDSEGKVTEMVNHVETTTTKPKATVTPYIAPTAAPAIPQTAVPTVAPTVSPIVVPTTTIETTTANTAELYIASTTTYTESYEGRDENSCKVTYKKPIIAGKNADEVSNINSSIDELLGELSETLESQIENMSSTPKTITFTKVEISSLTTTKVRILFTGKKTPRSGTSTTIKYRITYEREDGSATIDSVSS